MFCLNYLLYAFCKCFSRITAFSAGWDHMLTTCSCWMLVLILNTILEFSHWNKKKFKNWNVSNKWYSGYVYHNLNSLQYLALKQNELPIYFMSFVILFLLQYIFSLFHHSECYKRFSRNFAPYVSCEMGGSVKCKASLWGIYFYLKKN